ncbi:MAG: hypothetical protein HY828_06590 [Actinobacteria bacterium]|nr:hypothetical protein [Actinomycetota bacterium]
MTYLAFDPIQVHGLAAAMVRSLDELWTVRCDDPAAYEALRTVRLLRDEIETQWLPLARRVAASLSLTGKALPADLGELRNSLAFVMAVGTDWAVTDDPSGSDLMTPEEARALGARMNRADAASFVSDPAELRWLAGRLERIAADPVLAASFLANFHEWALWGDALGRLRARIVAGVDARTTVTVPELDGVFAAMAHVERSTEPAWLTEMNPYAAAAMVRFLGLHGEALAVAADRILAQHPITDMDALSGPNAADVLFPLVAADSVASARFLSLATRHPEVLFDRPSDTAAGYRLVLHATDPARMSAEQAGVILPRLVQHFATTDPSCDEACYTAQERPENWRAFLVDLVSPWMLQFSPQNQQWPLSNEGRERLLSFVLEDEASLQRFVERADRVQAGFVTSISSGEEHALDELGAFMAMIGALIVNNREQTSLTRQKGWEMITTLAGLLTAAIPGIAVGAGAAMGLVIIGSSVAPDPRGTARQAGFGADLASTSAGAAVAEKIALQWKADGSLPADFAMPPTADPQADLPSQEFMWEFDDWRASLPGGEYGPLADHVTRHVYAVINPGMMGAHSVTLFMP